MLEREADTRKSEEVGECHAGDERIERNSKVWWELDQWASPNFEEGA